MQTATAPGVATRDVFAFSPARRAYAVFVAVSILVLICSGGMVTSENAGMSVPDWPNSYGYNMFAFPFSRWVGAVLLEHSHRLAASVEGVLIIVLAGWLWYAEPRKWVRNLGYAALGGVILQGIVGGLRVVFHADWIGIPHALLAQAFFALAAFIALTQSAWWHRLGEGTAPAEVWGIAKPLRRVVLAICILIYLQLGLGAAMRHAHAGLAILDFPTAYGHWWPRVHPADIPAINAQRTEVLHMPPTSLAQIHLQMTHRMLAAIIFAGVLAVTWMTWRRRETLPAGLRRLGLLWPLLLGVQITLGMYTIWSQKAADIATAHVAVGAASLVWGILLYAGFARWTSTILRPAGVLSAAAERLAGPLHVRNAAEVTA